MYRYTASFNQRLQDSSSANKKQRDIESPLGQPRKNTRQMTLGAPHIKLPDYNNYRQASSLSYLLVFHESDNDRRFMYLMWHIASGPLVHYAAETFLHERKSRIRAANFDIHMAQVELTAVITEPKCQRGNPIAESRTDASVVQLFLTVPSDPKRFRMRIKNGKGKHPHKSLQGCFYPTAFNGRYRQPPYPSDRETLAPCCAGSAPKLDG